MSTDFSQFKVMTFDVVGTLIDFEQGLKNGLAAISEKTGVAIDGEEALVAYRDARKQPDSILFPDDLARCYSVIAPKLGLPQSEEYGRLMVEAVGDSPAFPDSAAAMARLATKFKLVAMTNAQRWAFERYDVKLNHPFFKSFTTDDTKAEKPDPVYFEVVLAALAKEGIAKADILHVAQSQYHDIGVSRRLGFVNCWIERRHDQKGYGGTAEPESFTEPDFHFTSLEQLADAAGV